MRTNQFLLSALCLAGLTLNGCFSLTSDQKPPVIFTLHPTSPLQALSVSPSSKPVVLIVPKPFLPAGFETEQIALNLNGGKRLDYYTGAKWSAVLDDIIQEYVIKSGRVYFANDVIDTSDLNIPADYKLILTFGDFQPVYLGETGNGNPNIEVSMTVTLVSLPDEEVVRYFTLTQSALVKDNTMSSITTALSNLLQSVTYAAFKSIAPDLKLRPKAKTQ